MVRRSRWRAGLILALYAIAVGVLLVGLILALAVFLFLLAPVALLVIGWYLYWRKEERKSLFCPTCGRRYAREKGLACPEDGSALKNVV